MSLTVLCSYTPSSRGGGGMKLGFLNNEHMLHPSAQTAMTLQFVKVACTCTISGHRSNSYVTPCAAAAAAAGEGGGSSAVVNHMQAGGAGWERGGRQAGRHSPSVGSRDGRSDAARTGGSPPFKETFPLLVSRLR